MTAEASELGEVTRAHTLRFPLEWFEQVIDDWNKSISDKAELQSPAQVRAILSSLKEDIVSFSEQFEEVASLPVLTHAQLEQLCGHPVSDDYFREQYLIRLDLGDDVKAYPSFQFDETGIPKPAVVTLNMRLDAVREPWEAVSIWTWPLSSLDEFSPLRVLEMVDDPTTLFEAMQLP